MPGDSFISWSDAYRNMADKGAQLLFPSETLVRMFKGDYIPGRGKDYKGKSVLDVGCRGATTSCFLARSGLSPTSARAFFMFWRL